MAALVGGLGFLKARCLIPAFFLVPLYGLWRLERHGVPEMRAAGIAGWFMIESPLASEATMILAEWGPLSSSGRRSGSLAAPLERPAGLGQNRAGVEGAGRRGRGSRRT